MPAGKSLGIKELIRYVLRFLQLKRSMTKITTHNSQTLQF